MDCGGPTIFSRGRSDGKEADGVMTRVAIIGGGIGGLAAANALSRAGTEVAVYEAAAELKEIGAGVALHPNAMKVLRAVGLEDKVRAVAGRSEWALSRNWKTGRVITRTSRRQQAASFGAQGTTAHRADLLDVLAGGLPDGVVTLGKRCQEVLPAGDVAVARFADGTSVEADVIVGADGIHSRVRESLFGPDAPRFTGKICYRSIVKAAAVPGPPPDTENTQWLGPHGTIVLYPLRGTELINVVAHYDDADYRHESWIAECDAAEVLERYAGWHESVLRLLSAAGTWYKWALYDRDPIPRWTRGRVTLLGDAAHAMLPYLGQGACQALEDGAVLATALAAEPADPVRGLARYERTRRPRARSVVLTARERGLSNHLTSPWAAWRRDLSIAVRRRLSRRDPEGRGAAWLAAYDATSPDVLALASSRRRSAPRAARWPGSSGANRSSATRRLAASISSRYVSPRSVRCRRIARRLPGSISRRTRPASSSASTTVVTDRGTMPSRSASSVMRGGSPANVIMRSARSCPGVRPSGASWAACALRSRRASPRSRSAS
jgi:salicylate hydroxylase